jgi:hypothetical protein
VDHVHHGEEGANPHSPRERTLNAELCQTTIGARLRSIDGSVVYALAESVGVAARARFVQAAAAEKARTATVKTHSAL